MKQYKNILEEIKKAGEAIETMTAEIMKLDYTEERRQAAQNGGRFNNKDWRYYNDEAKKNAGKIAELSNAIYNKEIERLILRANSRAALLVEAVPVILKACEKYNGKSYGEKTAEKIREEVKKSGYGFYFEGYKKSRLTVYKLNEEGYRTHADEATARATDENEHTAAFITPDNKLNIANVIIKPFSDVYTEDTAEAAAKTADAIRAYSEAVENLEKQRRELCDMLPAGLPNPEYIKSFYIRF